MQELTEEQVMEQAREVMGDEATVRRNSLVFNAITEMTWPLMCEHDLVSCITGARIAFDVCRHYGIKVAAVCTRVRVYNAPLLERIRNGEIPESAEQIEAWGKVDGSWNVGIGGFGYDKPGRFDGHLVAVALGRVMLDPTLPQVNRPKHGIDLVPSPAQVPEGWPGTVEDAIQLLTNNCLLTYEAVVPDDRRWVGTESWYVREMRQPIEDAIVAAVDSALSAL